MENQRFCLNRFIGSRPCCDNIWVVISGDQKIKEFSVEGVMSQDAVKVLNKAIKKSQEVAAAQMKENMGDLSALLGGLGGK